MAPGRSSPRSSWRGSRRPRRQGAAVRSCRSQGPWGASSMGRSRSTIDETLPAAAQTPQGIRCVRRRPRLAERPPGGVEPDDEAALLRPVGSGPWGPGGSTNLEVTLPDDLAKVEAALVARGDVAAAPVVPRRFRDHGHPFGPGARSASAPPRSTAPRSSTALDGDVASMRREALLGARPRRPRPPLTGRPGDAAASPAQKCSPRALARSPPPGYTPFADRRHPRRGAAALCRYLDAMAATIAPESARPRPREHEGVFRGLAGSRAPGGINAGAVAVVVLDGRGSACGDGPLHDTLSRSLRAPSRWRPATSGLPCGPTVYSQVHIGNFRSFLFADLLVRDLRWQGLG